MFFILIGALWVKVPPPNGSAESCSGFCGVSFLSLVPVVVSLYHDSHLPQGNFLSLCLGLRNHGPALYVSSNNKPDLSEALRDFSENSKMNEGCCVDFVMLFYYFPITS